MKKIEKIISKALKFITTDIWRIRLSELPKSRSFLIKQLRIIIIAFNGFKENKCQLQASALTYYSLMAIVPVFAMMFGIAKGFGFEKNLEEFITQKLEGQEEVLNTVLEFVHTTIEGTKGGLIAGVGLALLFWSVMQLLSSIEGSFNDIWEIKKSRNFVRKFADYLSIMLIAPVLIIVSSSMSFYIKSTLIKLSQEVEIVNMISPYLFSVLRFIPYILIWFLLTLIYMIMPNTNVKFKPALFGGIVAGSLFQLMQYWYFGIQMKVSGYNAIYGSFAALPLLLLWLQISWLAILLGAEIAFAAQNVSKFEYEKDSHNISNNFRRQLALLISNKVFKNFNEGVEPLTSTEISKELEIPIRIVRRIVHELVECKVFSEVTTEAYKERAYQPARNINTIKVKDVFEALDEKGVKDIKIKQTEELKRIEDILGSFNFSINDSDNNVLIKDI